MMEKFHWTSAAGVEIVLPRIKKIPGRLIRQHRKLEGLDFVFTLVEAVADEDTLAKIDELDLGEQNELFEKWQSAVSVGESSGSSI